MSNRSSSSSENAFDVEELSEFRTRCKELRREKDLLRDSQSQSFELIRALYGNMNIDEQSTSSPIQIGMRLETHVKTLSESRTEDKICIQELERELNNCLQEIDYLQDQLNLRTTEVNYLGEHICGLQLKLADMENLEDGVEMLREDLKRSNSERQFLIQELEKKDIDLKNTSLCVEKLEESVSSDGLEYQCEIESMKLDQLALEQSCFEAKKSQEETVQENARMSKLIQDLELRIQEAEKIIKCLDEENKDLRKKLETSEMNAKVVCGKVEERFHEWLNEADQSSSVLENDKSSSCDVLGPLLSKRTCLGAPDEDSRGQLDKMSTQIHEYELLVSQLKEEMKEVRLKAKEEAEDLAQEMAELRYQMTGLLEEECKRRACIEQISLQRIAELEAQLGKGRSESSNQDQMKVITGLEQIHGA